MYVLYGVLYALSRFSNHAESSAHGTETYHKHHSIYVFIGVEDAGQQQSPWYTQYNEGDLWEGEKKTMYLDLGLEEGQSTVERIDWMNWRD